MLTTLYKSSEFWRMLALVTAPLAAAAEAVVLEVEGERGWKAERREGNNWLALGLSIDCSSRSYHSRSSAAEIRDLSLFCSALKTYSRHVYNHFIIQGWQIPRGWEYQMKIQILKIRCDIFEKKNFFF